MRVEEVVSVGGCKVVSVCGCKVVSKLVDEYAFGSRIYLVVVCIW